MHSSRMCTDHISVSRRIPCTPPFATHPLPPFTMYAPLFTMHTPFCHAHHPPIFHACPLHHACPPLSPHTPPLPCMPPSNHARPPVNRITHACENITLPQLRCWRQLLTSSLNLNLAQCQIFPYIWRVTYSDVSAINSTRTCIDSCP